MSGTARDPGLQPERTALAWQRTVLAQLVGTAALLHLAVLELDAAVLAGATILVATAVVPLARRRCAAPRPAAGAASAGNPSAGPGGVLPLVVAAGAAVLGLAATAAVVAGLV